MNKWTLLFFYFFEIVVSISKYSIGTTSQRVWMCTTIKLKSWVRCWSCEILWLCCWIMENVFKLISKCIIYGLAVNFWVAICCPSFLFWSSLSATSLSILFFKILIYSLILTVHYDYLLQKMFIFVQIWTLHSGSSCAVGKYCILYTLGFEHLIHWESWVSHCPSIIFFRILILCLIFFPNVISSVQLHAMELVSINMNFWMRPWPWIYLTMGGVIGKAANGIGGVLGNAFLTPIRTIFGGSCEWEYFPSYYLSWFASVPLIGPGFKWILNSKPS